MSSLADVLKAGLKDTFKIKLKDRTAAFKHEREEKGDKFRQNFRNITNSPLPVSPVPSKRKLSTKLKAKSPPKAKQELTRQERLVKWQEMRRKKKEEDRKNERPIFKVQRVDANKLYKFPSPVLKLKPQNGANFKFGKIQSVKEEEPATIAMATRNRTRGILKVPDKKKMAENVLPEEPIEDPQASKQTSAKNEAFNLDQRHTIVFPNAMMTPEENPRRKTYAKTPISRAIFKMPNLEDENSSDQTHESDEGSKEQITLDRKSTLRNRKILAVKPIRSEGISSTKESNKTATIINKLPKNKSTVGQTIDLSEASTSAVPRKKIIKKRNLDLNVVQEGTNEEPKKTENKVKRISSKSKGNKRSNTKISLEPPRKSSRKIGRLLDHEANQAIETVPEEELMKIKRSSKLLSELSVLAKTTKLPNTPAPNMGFEVSSPIRENPSKSSKKSRKLLAAETNAIDENMSANVKTRKRSSKVLSGPSGSSETTKMGGSPGQESKVLATSSKKAPSRKSSRKSSKILATETKTIDETTPKQNIISALNQSSGGNSTLNTTFTLDDDDDEEEEKKPDTPKKESQENIVYVSPFVTISRGKRNAAREHKQRSSTGGLSHLSPHTTGPKAAAAYFTRLLNDEIARINEMCDKWKSTMETDDLPEGADDMIKTAIGQSKLLMTKKMQRFRDLIAACTAEDGEQKVTSTDLHGFWDMLSLEVNNVHARFDNLDKMRDNNWQEILPEVKKATKSAAVTRGKKTAANKNVKRGRVESKIKDAIKAARARQRATATTTTSAKNSPIAKSPRVSRVLKTPSAKTPRRSTLLMSVLANEANKVVTTSPGLVMTRISQIGKLRRSTNTPAAKSILKTPTSMNINNKSVNFNERNNLIIASSPDSVENRENDVNELNKSREEEEETPDTTGGGVVQAKNISLKHTPHVRKSSRRYSKCKLFTSS